MYESQNAVIIGTPCTTTASNISKGNTKILIMIFSGKYKYWITKTANTTTGIQINTRKVEMVSEYLYLIQSPLGFLKYVKALTDKTVKLARQYMTSVVLFSATICLSKHELTTSEYSVMWTRYMHTIRYFWILPYLSNQDSFVTKINQSTDSAAAKVNVSDKQTLSMLNNMQKTLPLVKLCSPQRRRISKAVVNV
jgi:hypothetical protein